jgi:hypothetical protein
MSKTITIKNVADFAKAIADIPLTKNYQRFFRGHSDKNYQLEPRLYRKPELLIKYEKAVIREANIRCPHELPSSLTFFEILVKLQHYGFPTRLLDLTSNALVALYFACGINDGKKGEVVIFNIPNGDVKYYDSDTVSVISNIARRDTDFDLSAFPTDKNKFNEDPEIGRLLHDIRLDKPAFRPLIEPNDFKRVIAVRTRLDNPRIARQDGAFLLFGIDKKKTVPAKVPKEWIICGKKEPQIIISNKDKLLEELTHFGISEQSLFPELASQAGPVISSFTKK